MQFHSEWLLDDPIEIATDLEKNLHSKDEIEDLSTGENLSDIAKAIFLLEKGQLSQKLWVVQELSSIMSHPNSDQVMAELIVKVN